MNRQNITLLQLAALGVHRDDPFGDGIRLEKIRNPSTGRNAALRLLKERTTPLVFEVNEILREYGHILNDENVWRKDGTLRSHVLNNMADPEEYL